MVKLYKDWYLDADPFQYIVGKVKERERDGKRTKEFVSPTYHPTIAAAANHVLEAETRGQVADGSLSDIAEVMALYSSVADDLENAIECIPGDSFKRLCFKDFRPQGMETRCRG